MFFFFFFQAEDGIRDVAVTGVQTCALPIFCQAAAEKNGPTEAPALGPASRPLKKFLRGLKKATSPPSMGQGSSLALHSSDGGEIEPLQRVPGRKALMRPPWTSSRPRRSRGQG